MKFFIAAAAVAVVLAKDDAKKDDKKGEKKDDKAETKDTCLTGMKMAAFTDDKCTKAKVDDKKKAEVVEIKDAQLKALNSKCNAVDAADQAMMPGSIKDAKSMSSTCDSKALNIKMYPEDECKGKATAVELGWGDCKEVKAKDKDGKAVSYYYTLTGATALQAGAAIALAYVGAQF